MKSIESFNAQSEQSEQAFERFSGLSLETVSYEALPSSVKEYFESRSAMYINQAEYNPQNFEKLLTFTFPNGDIGYIAEQLKDYSNEAGIERLTYITDTRDGVELGYLELRLNIASDMSYFKNKPFVGFNRTNEGFQRQGLGERRLQIANAYARSYYQTVLNSDTVIDDSARALWDSLVEKGEAEKYVEGSVDRYRFVS